MLRVKLQRLTIEELAELAKKTIELARSNENIEIIASPLYITLEGGFVNYDQFIIQKTSDSTCGEIRRLDLLRDSYHSAAKRVLKGFATFSTPKSEAAKRLLHLFDEAGSIFHLTYAEENIILDNLLEKLSTPQAKKDLEVLGVQEEHAQFVKTQKDFSDLYNKLASTSEIRQQPSATSLRRALEKSMNDFYSQVTTLREMYPWKEIYTDLYELFVEINDDLD